MVIQYILMKGSVKIQAKQYIEENFSLIAHNNWGRVWDALTRMESKNDLVRVNYPTLIL